MTAITLDLVPAGFMLRFITTQQLTNHQLQTGHIHMNNLLKLAALILLAISSGFASAEMSSPAQDERIGSQGKGDHAYAVIDVGQGIAADYCPTQTAGVTCTNTASITQFGLGYQFTKSIAIETGYLSSGEINSSTCTTTICANSGGSGTADSKLSLSGLRLSVVMSAPVNDTVSFIGKLGLFNSTVSSSNKLANNSFSTSSSYDNSTIAYGLGVLINLNDSIALRVLYEDMGAVKASSVGTGSNLTAVSGGVLVNF